MAAHWFLKEDHSRFRNSISSVIDEVAGELARPDARNTLGDEHDQCQFLFTGIYTLMKYRQEEFTRHLLCCSKIPDPVVELRYYRSRVKRDRANGKPQFIEKETGADFALALQIDLPDLIQAERSVLGQAKILSDRVAHLNKCQLDKLLEVAGPESAAYMLWGVEYPPTVVTAENIESYIRTRPTNSLEPGILTLGRSLAEFFCDSFIGLWFGRDYNPERECEDPPSTSIGVLYHFLHRGVPPPNVVYFGIRYRRGRDAPGFIVRDIKDVYAR